MHLKQHLSRLWIAIVLAPALSAQIVLDNFNSGTASGSVIAGTTWVGQVTQNATSITVGGSAKDDSGWQTLGLNLNATGMNYVSITAQRDSGNTAVNLTVGFTDSSFNYQGFSVPTSMFAFDALTTVNIPITSWGSVDFTHITDWSIGGAAGVGSATFHMTLDNLQLTAAIPEPSTYAALAGIGMLAAAIVQRKRRGRQDAAAR